MPSVLTGQDKEGCFDLKHSKSPLICRDSFSVFFRNQFSYPFVVKRILGVTPNPTVSMI